MKILYLCNCKCSCNVSSGCIVNGGPCSHITDVNYAKNYKETPIITDEKNFVNLSNGFNEACYFEEEQNG